MGSSTPHENAPSSSFTHENVGVPYSSYIPHEDWSPLYSPLSSAACSVSTVGYNVFINNRGPDVKATFATDLYHRLATCGFRVFLDKYEMRAGLDLACQIKQAIETASIHIAIFSRRYAESCWCLDELLQMWLKTCESDRDILIPVFYRVKPFEVRSMAKGPYAEARLSHEKKNRFNPSWASALCDAANISGYELEECNGGYEKLLNEVVGRVLEKGKKTPSEYVTVEEFFRTAPWQQPRLKAMVVGIVGPGAVGKTTLAQNFYHSKRSEYSGSCFLPDVKESSGISLQRTLAKELIQGMGVSLQSTLGKELTVKELTQGMDVLIVLDDVDHAGQMDEVLSILDNLGSNSLILVTSRHKHVLREARIPETSIYNLTGLFTPSPNTNTKFRLGCDTLKNIPSSLHPFTRLKELWLHDSPNLKRLSCSYGLLNQLTELNIVDCGINSLQGDMNKLEVFRVYNCPLGELSFRKVPGKTILGRESRYLGASSQSSPQSFPQDVCPNLEHLLINRCRVLSKVGPLPATLITVDLSYCPTLREIKGLDYLARLEQLDISGCEKVEELPSLQTLTCLTSLKASRCYKLKSIRGLAGHNTKLRKLYVRKCHELRELPGVEHCKSLEELDARDCPELQWDDGVPQQLRQRLKAGLKTDKVDH